MRTDPASKAVPFETVLREERSQLAERRKSVKQPWKGGYVGLAFSGGGIRSATFNLGILQGLVERKLLPYVDYLSTVSGGGYLGSWLHGVIRRYFHGNPADAGKLLSPAEHPIPGSPEEDPISFLRKYSSYLAPELGLFSADFWVILVIWFRNIFLNLLILVPLLAGISIAAMLIGLSAAPLKCGIGQVWTVILLASFFLFLAVILAARGLRAAVTSRHCEEDPRVERQPVGIGQRGAIGCAISALLGSLVLAVNSVRITADPTAMWMTIVGLAACLACSLFALQLYGGFLDCYRAEHRDREAGGYAMLILLPIVTGTITALLLYGALAWIAGWDVWNTVAWGPPLIMLVCVTSVGFHIGLMGSDLPDFGREALARTGAFLNIALLAWALLFAIGVFGPYWLSLLALSYGKTTVTAIGAWVATTASGVLSGKSSQTSGAADHSQNNLSALEWIGKIAPTAFLVGFLLLISFGVHVGLHGLAQSTCRNVRPRGNSPEPNISLKLSVPAAGNTTVDLKYDKKPAPPPDWLQWLLPIAQEYWCVLDPYNDAGRWLLLFLGIAAAMVGILPWRFDINEFSLHHFYKNRLVRCYLGASRGKSRSASRLTGFDSCDDFPLSSLLAKPDESKDRCEAAGSKTYLGPYAILNGTVNMNQGSELAKRERQGESFTFTPLYCGYEPNKSPEDEQAIEKCKVSPGGYHRTPGYGHPAGLAIGTCTAISGAAANPNHGYHTSAPLAFLMTIFDVRLGWWVGNPRLKKPSEKAGPQYALKPLLSELFSQTDQRSKYLNISDGGHFENLGIYELVRRRCRYIIAGDGEEDPGLTFESLGGAVRKCRADFGVEIKIDPRRIQRKDGFSLTHCVVGRIFYPEDPPGWLLYFKASLTGDEPEDVSQYHAVHNDFPHEPTADQFFTESQFESYRRLGLHIVETAFENAVFEPPRIGKLFESLYRQWYPPSDISSDASSRNVNSYSALMKRLSDDPDLAYFDAQILRDIRPVPRSLPEGRKDEIDRKAFFYCLDLIQLMENVWSDLQFFETANRKNPKNAGWIETFRHWAGQPLFLDTWKQASYTFNPLFQQFFRWAGKKKGRRSKNQPV